MKRPQALRDLVKLHLETASHRQERYYNKKLREIGYEIRDLVMRRQHVLSLAVNFVSSKLAPKCKGPYTVIRVLSRVVYEVTDSEGRVDKVHLEDLKPSRNGVRPPSPRRTTGPQPADPPTRKAVEAGEGRSVGSEADQSPPTFHLGEREVGLANPKSMDPKALPTNHIPLPLYY